MIIWYNILFSCDSSDEAVSEESQDEEIEAVNTVTPKRKQGGVESTEDMEPSEETPSVRRRIDL